VHLDVDVLDPSVMPAVDAPTPGGIGYQELDNLLRGLVPVPECVGLEVTVFDPDFDLDRVYAQDLVNTLVSTLGPVGHPEPLIPAQKRAPRPRRAATTP
jgi:arginase